MPQVTYIEFHSNNNGVITRERTEFINPNYVYTRFVNNVLQETRNATQNEIDKLINHNILDDYTTRWNDLENLTPTIKTWITHAETTVTSWDTLTTAQRFAAMKLVVDRYGKILKGLLLLMSQLRNKIFQLIWILFIIL